MQYHQVKKTTPLCVDCGDTNYMGGGVIRITNLDNKRVVAPLFQFLPKRAISFFFCDYRWGKNTRCCPPLLLIIRTHRRNSPHTKRLPSRTACWPRKGGRWEARLLQNLFRRIRLKTCRTQTRGVFVPVSPGTS